VPDGELVAAGIAQSLGCAPEFAAEATRLVTAALDSPVVRRLRGATRVHFEVPFSDNDDGRVVEGRIDLLAEEPAGLLLVDFKTDSVEPGHEQQVASQYAPQMRAYVRAVRSATGRPVQAAQLLFLRTLVAVEMPA
jgi:ATP-dependent helicase/nuclease subunit A